MTPLGIEHASCRFVAYCLNHYATARPSEVSIVANLRAGPQTVWGSMPDNECFSSQRRHRLFPLQVLVKSLPGNFSLHVQRPGPEADRFSSYDPELKI